MLLGYGEAAGPEGRAREVVAVPAHRSEQYAFGFQASEQRLLQEETEADAFRRAADSLEAVLTDHAVPHDVVEIGDQHLAGR